MFESSSVDGSLLRSVLLMFLVECFLIFSSDTFSSRIFVQETSASNGSSATSCEARGMGSDWGS